MTLRATCHHCGHTFALAALDTAGPDRADRCPGCLAHLGPADLGPAARRIDEELRRLAVAVEELAERPGAFTLDALALRAEVIAAIDQLDEPPRLDASSRSVPAVRPGHRTSEGRRVNPPTDPLPSLASRPDADPCVRSRERPSPATP